MAGSCEGCGCQHSFIQGVHHIDQTKCPIHTGQLLALRILGPSPKRCGCDDSKYLLGLVDEMRLELVAAGAENAAIRASRERAHRDVLDLEARLSEALKERNGLREEKRLEEIRRYVQRG